MPLSTLVILLAVILLLVTVPAWPYSRGWGYRPSGWLGAILIILLIMAATGAF